MAMKCWKCSTAPVLGLVFVLGVAFLLSACDSNGGSSEGEAETQTIQQVLASTASFSRAEAAFAQSGADTGFGEASAGPITVFVPSNAAFSAVNETAFLASENASIRTSVMGYHVVEQELQAGEVSASQSVQTRSGATLDVEPVDGTTLRVNGSTATLVASADNGVVYEIDAVQLSTLTFLDRATVSAGLSRFADALRAAGIASQLEQGDPITIFAPSDAGFAPYRAADDLDRDVVVEWLTYHAVVGEQLSSMLPANGSLSTIEPDGGTIQVNTSGGVTVNGVPVQTADLRVQNGIIHVIERPLTSSLSIAEHASIRSDLTTLAAAIGGPDATTVPVLDDESQRLTLFAPTEDGFADVDVDELVGEQTLLEEVLEYHLLDDGAYSADDLATGSPTRSTAEGQTVAIQASTASLQINRATVTAASLSSANGFIHAVDGVLLETTRGSERIQLTSRYSILQQALNRVGLTATLASGTYTIFPPSNDAFLAALDSDNSGAVEDDEFPSNATLQDILLYHVVPGTVPSGNIDDNDSATTLEGSSLLFDVAATGVITINPSSDAATITRRDLGAENGILHEVDTLLMP